MKNYNNNNNNNNKPKIRETRFNDILATNLDSTIENRYCQHCHLKLVHNPQNRTSDKYLYHCPRCNCGPVNIHQTQPEEKIIVQFPTHNAQSFTNKKLIAQPESQRLSRSTYFINKNIQKKNEIENTDPYLQNFLKKSNQLTITSIDYWDPNEEE